MMQQNRPKISFGKQTDVCLVCHCVNVAGFKFCGKCGAKAKPEFPFRSGFADELAITSPYKNEKRNTITSRRQTSVQGKKNKKFFVTRVLSKFTVKQRKNMVRFLFAVVLMLSGLLVSGNTGFVQPEANARWGDFRTFLARSLELTHPELDSIFAQALNMAPLPTSMIDRSQSEKIEATLRQIFQQPDLEIFPNPFFEAPSTEFMLESGSEGGKFVDVPLSHPVYTALRPLHEIGLSCADHNNRIRPYEKIAWEDWNQAIEKLLRILAVDSGVGFEREQGRSRFMSNIELRNYLEHLREKLYIKENKPLIYARSESYPSRLEAFAALSAVLQELEASL